MVFLLCYAVAVWVIAAIHRRRWPAFAAIIGGLPPIILGALFCARFFVGVSRAGAETAAAAADAAEGQRMIIYLVAGAMVALVTGVGLFIALQPRRAPDRPCGACGYDLAGNLSGVCPECGANVTLPVTLHRPARPALPEMTPPVAPLVSQIVADGGFRTRVHEAHQRAADA